MCKRVNLFRKELEDIMKNLTKLLVLAMVAGLTSCASDEEQTGRNYRYVGNNHDCGEALIQDKPEPAPVRQYQQPAPMPVARPCVTCQAAAPVAPAPRPCNTCQPTEYTVRTPVKVVYKNTTYHTVYEPRTYETTAYETRPFNRDEACATGNCVNTQAPVVTQQPVLQQPAAAAAAPATVEVYEK